MKIQYPHPPREKNPRMWRSLGELEGSPEFEQWLHREFPPGADVWQGSGLSRRDFIKLLGASMALAGVGLSGCRRPEAYLVPFNQSVEFTIPGKNLYYATSMPTRIGHLPLIAATVDGRPIKLEGNPLHPESNGSTNAFAQASILDLYDPHRSKSIVRKNPAGGATPASLEDWQAALAQLRSEWQSDSRARIAIVAERAYSPTRNRLRALLESTYPSLLWCEYEPLGDDLAQAAAAIAFAPGTRLLPDFAQATVILALDSDFLNPSETSPTLTASFFPRRNPDRSGLPMNRLYVAESAYSLTGGMADHRLPIHASLIPYFLAELCRLVADRLQDALLGELAKALPAPPQLQPHLPWLRELAADLCAHRSDALVLCGYQQPLATQLLTIALNHALGAIGRSLLPVQTDHPPTTSLSDICSALRDGQVHTLILLGGNPAYNAPANFDFPAAALKARNVLRLGLFEDESSQLAHWHLPAAHYLESWSDGRSPAGTYTPVQPMILPLWNGIPELDFLASLAGLPQPEGPSLVRETFNSLAASLGNTPDDLLWAQFLQNGFLSNSAYPRTSASYNPDALSLALVANPPPPPSQTELVFLQSSSTDDGRYANNSWLQETPDFATKLTWDNALLMSVAEMKRLGLRDGAIVEISTSTASIQAAAIAAPGQPEGSYAIALGYGRNGVSALMENVGFNAYPLRTSTSPRYLPNVQIRPLPSAKNYTFARTQEHHSMEGRDLFREATLQRYQQQPDFPKHMGEFAHLPPLVQKAHQLFDHTFLTAPEQWAMAIDLNLCTGCNACLLACRAENNVPVVGKEQVRRGRDMAWIRIDRWFAGDPANPEMLAHPITCQQCENAPCETVCPVNATVHSEDGLNLMAYNRCIGTRYCANNCPWKVRRFNFFDYNQRPLDKLYWGPLAPKGMAESLKLVKNPNVTVRMRGVMEKCTFCIQRIEEAKIARLVQAGPRNKNEVPVGPFQTACQQACPSDAIVFGNQNDPNSLVAKLRQADRGYTMFTYLNARPRITYLARIKNPNPAMPGAELVGNINSTPHSPHSEKKPAAAEPHALAPAELLPSGVNHGLPTPSNSNS